jgi:hypothetical protein
VADKPCDGTASSSTANSANCQHCRQMAARIRGDGRRPGRARLLGRVIVMRVCESGGGAATAKLGGRAVRAVSATPCWISLPAEVEPTRMQCFFHVKYVSVPPKIDPKCTASANDNVAAGHACPAAVPTPPATAHRPPTEFTHRTRARSQWACHGTVSTCQPPPPLSSCPLHAAGGYMHRRELHADRAAQLGLQPKRPMRIAKNGRYP